MASTLTQRRRETLEDIARGATATESARSGWIYRLTGGHGKILPRDAVDWLKDAGLVEQQAAPMGDYRSPLVLTHTGKATLAQPVAAPRLTDRRREVLATIAKGATATSHIGRGWSYRASGLHGEALPKVATEWLLEARLIERQPAAWGTNRCPLTLTDAGRSALAQ